MSEVVPDAAASIVKRIITLKNYSEFKKCNIRLKMRTVILLSIIFLMAGFICEPLKAQPCGTNWRDAYGVSGAQKVIFANGRFYAVHGNIVKNSLDGQIWQETKTPVTESLWDIVFNGDIFVAVGDNGQIVVSDDGTEWNSVESGVTGSLRGIAYGPSGFSAVGLYQTVLLSPDGITWTKIDICSAASWLESVTYAAGTYVAVGSSGAILSSVDGQSWTCQNFGSYEYWDVTYGAGRFIAVGCGGQILTSLDGWSWSFVNTDIEDEWCFWGVNYCGCKFIATAGFGDYAVSTDGLTWEKRNFPFWDYLRDVAYGNGRYVMAADLEWLVSDNGLDWKQYNSGELWIGQSTFANGRHWLACFDDRSNRPGSIISSADGYIWQTQVIQDVFPMGIVYGDSGYIVVGFNDMYNVADHGVIIISKDGETWTEEPAPPDFLFSVCYADVHYVATGRNGLILVSRDGLGWTKVDSGTSQWLLRVTYGNGVYVAVGTYGTILTSTDTINWTVQNSTTTENLWGVAYGDGKFVAVSDSGFLMTSPDGVTWTIQHGAPQDGYYFQAVEYEDGIFLASGGADSVLISEDGISWQKYTIGDHHEQYFAITYGDGIFVAAGVYGNVLISDCQLNGYVSCGAGSNHVPFTTKFNALANGGTPPYTYSWDFGDGGTSDEKTPSHTFSSTGTFSIKLKISDSTGDYVIDDHSSVTVGPFCLIDSCSTSVVTHGFVGSTINFGVQVNYSDCDCSSESVWVFGDGSTQLAGENVSHVYNDAGSYEWSCTTTSDTDSYLSNGTIVIDPDPIINPVVTEVKKKQRRPFRLIITGSNFHEGCVIEINGTPVPTTNYKSSERLVAKKGKVLKAMLPKGEAVQITVRNIDDGGVSLPFSFTR